MPTIITDPGPEDKQPEHQVEVKALNLLVIRCSDFDRSLDFYRALGLNFSLRVGSASALVPGPEFPLTADEPGADIPCTSFDLIPAGEQKETTGVSFGFFVSSVDLAINNALPYGGEILSEPADWPYGRKAAIQDPDGNRIELSEDPVGSLTGDHGYVQAVGSAPALDQRASPNRAGQPPRDDPGEAPRRRRWRDQAQRRNPTRFYELRRHPGGPVSPPLLRERSGPSRPSGAGHSRRRPMRPIETGFAARPLHRGCRLSRQPRIGSGCEPRRVAPWLPPAAEHLRSRHLPPGSQVLRTLGDGGTLIQRRNARWEPALQHLLQLPLVKRLAQEVVHSGG